MRTQEELNKEYTELVAQLGDLVVKAKDNAKLQAEAHGKVIALQEEAKQLFEAAKLAAAVVEEPKA